MQKYRKQKSLNRKLTLAFMLVAFTTVGLVGLFIRVTSTYQLEKMIVDQQRSSLMKLLRGYYARNNSWQGISDEWESLHHQVSLTGPDLDDLNESQANQQHENMGMGDDDLFGIANSQGVVMVPVDQNYPPGAKLPGDILKAGTPLIIAGEQVATILDSKRLPSLNPEEALYLQRTNWALLLAILGALAVAYLVGKNLAHALTSPLDALKEASQNIAHGHLEQQVEINSDDEMGQLAMAFNRMSREVARVNQLRRQMTADIAHELGNPLTVISGYVEGLEDGSISPTQERFQLIRAEIEHLQNLVGDLRMLSLADAGELHLAPHWVYPKDLLNKAAVLFKQSAEQRNISLSVEADENLPLIKVDSDRMIQILQNLVINSLRYTPTDGRIILSAKQVDHQVDISVEDTGTGIDPQELPDIFDRFRRGDKSRHTDSEQSGLGLAIVKALAELHGGSVWAESTLDKGTTIHVLIPSYP